MELWLMTMKYGISHYEVMNLTTILIENLVYGESQTTFSHTQPYT